MSGVRAVFLDVDDTLVDYQASARAAFAGALGGEFDAAGYAEFGALLHYDRYLAGELGFQQMREQRMAEYLERAGRRADVERAALIERDRFAALVAGCALFVDAAPCLAELRSRGLRLGLITNNDPEHQREKLAHVGLLDGVDAVLISGELGYAKPDPRIFERACEAVGVTPAQALHVGDNLAADVHGALAAGLRAVWLDRAGTGLPEGADERIEVVRGLDEVPGLL